MVVLSAPSLGVHVKDPLIPNFLRIDTKWKKNWILRGLVQNRDMKDCYCETCLCATPSAIDWKEFHEYSSSVLPFAQIPGAMLPVSFCCLHFPTTGEEYDDVCKPLLEQNATILVSRPSTLTPSKKRRLRRKRLEAYRSGWIGPPALNTYLFKRFPPKCRNLFSWVLDRFLFL